MGCVRCRFGNTGRGTLRPHRREAPENEERGQLAQSLGEPAVPVVPVTVEVGHDVAQLVRELVRVLAPVGVACAEPYPVGAQVVGYLRRPSPRRHVNGRVRLFSECRQQNVGRRVEHAAYRAQAGRPPVAVFDRQQWRGIVPHHTVIYRIEEGSRIAVRGPSCRHAGGGGTVGPVRMER